ncbi:MAG: hypothetical protein M3550_09305 [Actinomycetota bacterium]|nr:hypothetical protein [Actinomycetota bacterium]
MATPRRDFAFTLLDGRRVIVRQHGPGENWSIHVYPPDSEGPILGYASASQHSHRRAPRSRTVRR